ncbi:hypothetical protein STAFG_5193 [Streptomyces afghaniensis 772]|uniref:Uncharacterized protein n=1 Tax=Streptomyces afghaniensis 772 TaxID=1283301 RepID=S4MVJ0_9ACTN|nr:hypothetical protein STAFG_5193 [Streptomyces afghaniensis 772]
MSGELPPDSERSRSRVRRCPSGTFEAGVSGAARSSRQAMAEPWRSDGDRNQRWRT